MIAKPTNYTETLYLTVIALVDFQGYFKCLQNSIALRGKRMTCTVLQCHLGDRAVKVQTSSEPPEIE